MWLTNRYICTFVQTYFPHALKIWPFFMISSSLPCGSKTATTVSTSTSIDLSELHKSFMLFFVVVASCSWSFLWWACWFFAAFGSLKFHYLHEDHQLKSSKDQWILIEHEHRFIGCNITPSSQHALFFLLSPKICLPLKILREIISVWKMQSKVQVCKWRQTRLEFEDRKSSQKWRYGNWSILWVVPLPSNSQHQDYYIFIRESL